MIAVRINGTKPQRALRRRQDATAYLDDGLGEVHPPAQQAVEVVPLLLQGSQIRLELSLGLLVPHGEELPADLQSVDEAALIPLEQQLCVLEINRWREAGVKDDVL